MVTRHDAKILAMCETCRNVSLKPEDTSIVRSCKHYDAKMSIAGANEPLGLPGGYVPPWRINS